MKFLFIHQNYPGQFAGLVQAISDLKNHQIVAMVDEKNLHEAQQLLPKEVVLISYTPPKNEVNKHPYLTTTSRAIDRGQVVATYAQALKQKNFYPDIIVVHTGWGEALFLKAVYPNAKIIGYFEYYYRSQGGDVGFDNEFYQPTTENLQRIQIKNAHHLLSYECCDIGVTPTKWQAQQLPSAYLPKINVIHEGIDTATVVPSDTASFTINASLTLTKQHQVVTYVSRGLEPYRGFHHFMRALPRILQLCPNAHILIAGDNEVSYGPKPKNAAYWRDVMLQELGNTLDLSRVHFLGKLPYAQYLSLLQISTVHVYLTYPFVLSWSMLEAMSACCVVVGSSTGPVTEVITHDKNGLLVDFFDDAKIANTVVSVLNNKQQYAPLGIAARNTIIKQYDAQSICIPAWFKLLGIAH